MILNEWVMKKYRKGDNAMINENYYHRTHKNFSRNYDPNYKGKIELHDNPMNLFSISNTDKEVELDIFKRC